LNFVFIGVVRKFKDKAWSANVGTNGVKKKKFPVLNAAEMVFSRQKVGALYTMCHLVVGKSAANVEAKGT